MQYNDNNLLRIIIEKESCELSNHHSTSHFEKKKKKVERKFPQKIPTQNNEIFSIVNKLQCFDVGAL